MIVRKKNVDMKVSNIKYRKAITAYQMDRLYNIIFLKTYLVKMTRKEKNALEYDAIATYLNEWTIEQIDEHINNRIEQLGLKQYGGLYENCLKTLQNRSKKLHL